MIVVTGAAGFIGSCIVAKLNERGREDLILVDHLDDDIKKKNLDNKIYAQYFEKDEFLKAVQSNAFDTPIECVIHMGACSSTTLQDAQYYRQNNYEYTLTLAKWCVKHQVHFIYASSAATYGDGSKGYRDDDQTTHHCQPLNLYGQSKQKFDLWFLDNADKEKIVGLKFFNVFGPNEYHKKDMRSIVAKAYEGVVKEGKMFLFKSYREDYADGEQKRDFIYVKDAVDVVMFFLDNPDIHGIYNVGTGHARTWIDLAKSLFAAVGKRLNVEYIDMPETLKDKYQYFTQADMSKLCSAGYAKKFTPLEDAVSDYASYLKESKHI